VGKEAGREAGGMSDKVFTDVLAANQGGAQVEIGVQKTVLQPADPALQTNG
jgi:hypothetical protein